MARHEGVSGNLSERIPGSPPQPEAVLYEGGQKTSVSTRVAAAKRVAARPAYPLLVDGARDPEIPLLHQMVKLVQPCPPHLEGECGRVKGVESETQRVQRHVV